MSQDFNVQLSLNWKKCLNSIWATKKLKEFSQFKRKSFVNCVKNVFVLRTKQKKRIIDLVLKTTMFFPPYSPRKKIENEKKLICSICKCQKNFEVNSEQKFPHMHTLLHNQDININGPTIVCKNIKGKHRSIN